MHLMNIASAILRRRILRNLVIVTVMSIALGVGPTTLADHYIKNYSCTGPCLVTAWDAGASAAGTAHCVESDEWGQEWPEAELYESAWVFYICAWDGQTYNEAEVAAMDDNEFYGEARATYWWHTCVDGYSWQRCYGDSQSGEYSDEPGCPWW